MFLNTMVKVIKKIALILIGLLLSLISGELFFRIIPGNNLTYGIKQYRAPGPMSVEDMNKWQMFRSSALLGYEHIPNSPSYTSTPPFNFINSYGMIGREHILEKSEHIYRILVLGDSIAAQNFHIYLLEDWLNNNLFSGI